MKTALRLVVSAALAVIFTLVWHEFSYVESPRKVARITGDPQGAAPAVEESFFLDGINKQDMYVLEVSFFESYEGRKSLRFRLNGRVVQTLEPIGKHVFVDFPGEFLRNGKNLLEIRSEAEWRFKTIRLKNFYGYSSGIFNMIILNKQNEFRHSAADLGGSFYAIFLGLFFLTTTVLGLTVPDRKERPSLRWSAFRKLRFVIILFFFIILTAPLVTKYRIIAGSRSVLLLVGLYFILLHAQELGRFLNGAPKRFVRFLASWQEVIGLFVITRAAVYGIGYLSSLAIEKGRWFSSEMPSYFLSLFFKWDSFWYQEVIQLGYYFSPDKASNIAFFPLYPMVVKISSFFIGSPRTNGFVLSNVFALLAVIYLVKLIRLEYGDEKIAARTALYLLVFPGSLFLSYFYAESLFLFLTIAAFYFSRRKRWLAASTFGFLAALTRVMGVLVVIPLLIEYFRPRIESGKIRLNPIKAEASSFLLVPLGLLSFMGYCLVKFGRPLAFLHAHNAWLAEVSSPLETLASINLLPPPYRQIYVGFIVFAVVIFFILILKKLRPSYIVYAGLLLLTLLSAGILESVPRQLSVIFPLFIGMALLGRNKPAHHFFVLASAVLLALFTILSANGYWFV